MREAVTDGAALEAIEGALGEEFAPPRRNGELVFDSPWQSRAYAMATLLYGRDQLKWDEFAARLRGHDSPEYYDRWLGALIDVLRDHGVVSAKEIDAKAANFAREDEHAHTH